MQSCQSHHTHVQLHQSHCIHVLKGDMNINTHTHTLIRAVGLKKSVFVCVFLKEIFKEALKQLTEAASETETKSCVCILATTERLSWDMSFLLVTLAGSLIM